MKLKLVRQPSTEEATIGSLFVGDVWECWTLEDIVRKEKIYGETAIPPGTYKVIITWSPRFKKQLPLLIDVPGFDGVRIHPGNDADDTEGCILVGQTADVNWVGSSRAAFLSLYDKIQKAIAAGETVTLEITA